MPETIDTTTEEKGLREVCHEMLRALEAANLGESVGSGGPVDDSYYEAVLVLPDGRRMNMEFKPLPDEKGEPDYPPIDRIVASPVDSARWLAQGYRIDYQPGDGTRYECEIVGPYLIIRNLAMAVLDLSKQWDALRYTTDKNVPVGSWRALRPLLAALGNATGEPVMTDQDQRQEANLRARKYDGEPLNHKDAALGRLVRRAIENDG